MATVATQQIVTGGITPTYNAASGGGDKFTPDARTFIHIKNADASSHTVTVVTPRTIDGLAIADLAVAVPAGAERVIGPFPASDFADPTDGLAHVTWSAVTSVTFAVHRL